jgi:hypothetical protein
MSGALRFLEASTATCSHNTSKIFCVHRGKLSLEWVLLAKVVLCKPLNRIRSSSCLTHWLVPDEVHLTALPWILANHVREPPPAVVCQQYVVPVKMVIVPQISIHRQLQCYWCWTPRQQETCRWRHVERN